MLPVTTTSAQISKSNHRTTEVIAPPGCGKTYALVQKTCHLLTSGVSAETILILSFSNAAVSELKIRLTKTNTLHPSVGCNSDNANLSKVTIKTAHGYARSLIGPHHLLAENEQYALLKSAIVYIRGKIKKGKLWASADRHTLNARRAQLLELAKRENRRSVLDLICFMEASKQPLKFIVERSQYEGFAPYIATMRAVHKAFRIMKRRSQGIDFGDMLQLATEQIASGHGIPYSHILVDEYQDCSPAQVEFLVSLVTYSGCQLTVFGDPNQAIYGFGGTSYTPLSSVLPNVQTYSIPDSQRLTVENAALASTIVPSGQSVAIRSKRHGPRPCLVTSDSESSQAQQVVNNIMRLIANGSQPSQMAILARTKALLHPIEQALMDQGVNTIRLGMTRNHRHALRVLKLIRLIRLSEKRGESVTAEEVKKALPSVKNVPTACWEETSKTLRKAGLSSSLQGRYRICSKAYLHLLGGIRKNPEQQHDINRWEPLCSRYATYKQVRDAILNTQIDHVVSGTIHSAKGMEWKHVFVVGVTDGLLPFYRAGADPRSLAEERNLLYVAVTRAKDTLHLYHAPYYHTRSGKHFDGLSRFLDSSAPKLLTPMSNE